jgi:hypothetical protein
MKIQKFNESSEEKIHWSKERLTQHINDRYYLQEVLKNYLFWKTGDDPSETAYDVDNYFLDYNNKFCISYEDGDRESLVYRVQEKDYDELIMFLDNPEMMMNSKKYNL